MARQHDAPSGHPVLNLPITKGEVRFAVGHPEGMTSNSWKMWATGGHEVATSGGFATFQGWTIAR